jgi:hypothetical protein
MPHEIKNSPELLSKEPLYFQEVSRSIPQAASISFPRIYRETRDKGVPSKCNKMPHGAPMCWNQVHQIVEDDDLSYGSIS